MNCHKKTKNALYFSSVENISSEIWEDLGCENNWYFNSKYLLALAKNNPQLQFSYIILLNEQQKPVLFATLQTVDFYLDSVQNGLQSMTERIKCVGRKLRILSPEKSFKILTVGNTFVSGEHGIFIKENLDKKKLIKELANAVVQYVNSDKILKKEISAFMLKDFVKKSLFITDELRGYGYNSFNVEPNMVLYIDKNWTNFEDYLQAMKTKFRVKAKKAITQSADLIVKKVTQENSHKFLPKIAELYKSVSASSNFNLGEFNVKTYQTLKENLTDNYIVQVYCLNDNIVGFLSAMINQNSLDAHFVGIDYKYNRQYAVYQRMLYDYITIAINKKLSIINFGRTASEIKSSVGAVPQDLTIYLRHKKTIPNRLLKPFLKRIQPTPFRQNFPFKAE